MPQVLIDGISVEVKDLGTAQLVSKALKDRDTRIDALSGELTEKDEQIELFKVDAAVPPQFLKGKKKKEEKEEEEDNDDALETEDAHKEEDDETRSSHDAEVEALRSERDALQGQLDALAVDAGDLPEGLEEEDLEEDEKDSIDGLLGRLQSADADARSLIHDEIRSMVGGAPATDAIEDSRDDSEKVRWHNERRALVELAEVLHLDSYETLSSLELKRAVLSSYTGKDHSKSSHERLDGALPHIRERLAARADSLRRASSALLPNGGKRQPRVDAQTNYRNDLTTAWKRPSA